MLQPELVLHICVLLWVASVMLWSPRIHCIRLLCLFGWHGLLALDSALVCVNFPCFWVHFIWNWELLLPLDFLFHGIISVLLFFLFCSGILEEYSWFVLLSSLCCLRLLILLETPSLLCKEIPKQIKVSRKGNILLLMERVNSALASILILVVTVSSLSEVQPHSLSQLWIL